MNRTSTVVAILLSLVIILGLAGLAHLYIGGLTQVCDDMTLEDAKQIAIAGECGDRLIEGTQFCNSDTHTWWIDLDIEKPGCNPACVIHTETKEAEINWRCMGVIEECVINDDCAVFGKTGDCNCGCFNKDYQWWTAGGECFRSAPIDCKCVNGTCEGIFEGDMTFEEAIEIAEQSECIEEGNLTVGGYFVCADTCSWWVKMDVVNESCNMVCAVDTIEKTAEIKWRCMG